MNAKGWRRPQFPRSSSFNLYRIARIFLQDREFFAGLPGIGIAGRPCPLVPCFHLGEEDDLLD